MNVSVLVETDSRQGPDTYLSSSRHYVASSESLLPVECLLIDSAAGRTETNVEVRLIGQVGSAHRRRIGPAESRVGCAESESRYRNDRGRVIHDKLSLNP